MTGNETKWTIGPWTVHSNGDGSSSIRQEGTGKFLAFMAVDREEHMTLDEAEANAALIASAPDLYSALAEARPVLEALQAAHPLPDHDSAVGYGKALRVLRAALSKAEGR